jgi:MarR-like DNA-binding transcriptional regulator SgrR of sgrS sRNA
MSIVWRSCAISSVLALSLATPAATRPRYGGLLHVSLRATPTSLDPADSAGSVDDEARARIWPLLSDTLVTLDDHGAIKPRLASSWESEAGSRRWQFHLRKETVFSDGLALTSAAVAASLRANHPGWRIATLLDGITIEADQPLAGLLAELAMPSNIILRRDPGPKLVGTGPFEVSQWQPGKKLTLTAVEQYWDGRVFLDSVEIELGRNLRDQLVSLDLGRTDLAEVAPEQVRHAVSDGRRVVESRTLTLVALVFSRDAQSQEEKTARQALLRSVDRNAIRTVLFQGHAENAYGVLPSWMTGYDFLLAETASDPPVRGRNMAKWTLSFDAADAADRVVAERIELSARDAGMSVQLAPGKPNADVRLVRIPLASSDPWTALEQMSTAIGGSVPKPGHALEDLYAAERALIETQRVIPLVHVPRAYALGTSVRSWATSSLGDWQIENAWLEVAKH